MTPHARLARLLEESFSDPELRRFWAEYDSRQSASLPGAAASLSELAHACAGLVERHGRDRRLFALLRAARPKKSQEIDAIAVALSRAPGDHGANSRSRGPRWYPHPRAGSGRFVGRARELEQLHEMLMRSRMVGIVAQIRGLGGLGKSLLAIEYVRRHGDAWPGGVFWIDASPTWSSAAGSVDERLAWRFQVLAGFAPSLGVIPTPGDLAATGRAVERAIEEHTGGERHLWIVDDLPPGVDQAFVESLLPTSSAGALLITTRWMALDALPNRLDLDVLDAEAAHTLVTVRRPPRDPSEQAEARALAVDVGHHPLALDVLGALVRGDLSVAPYAHWRARLRAPGDDLDRCGEALHEQLPTGSERAITRVLATSLDRLETPLSLAILRIAAGLGEAPIPGDVLLEILTRLYRVTTDELERAVAELAAHALVTRVPDVGGLHVHAIVRWVARRWPTSTPPTERIDEECCDVLCRRFASANDIGKHADLLSLLPHAVRTSEEDTIEAVILGASVGHFAELRGHYHEARDRAEKAVRCFERRLVPVNPYMALAKNNLAVALKQLGDHRGAQAYFGQALVDYEKLNGPDDRLTLMALHNLGTTFEAEGDWRAACDLYRRVLADQRRVLGPDDPDTLHSLMHLAGMLSDRGELVDSRALLDPAVYDCESRLGPEHPTTLELQSFLAVTLKRQGELPRARALEERLYAASERLRGPEHPHTLMCAQQLAMTMALQQDFAGARALSGRTLEVQRRVLGPEHPRTLHSQHILALAEGQMNDLDSALPRMQETLEAQTRVLGPAHPHVLITQEELAWLCWRRGDRPRALNLLEAVLAGREAVLAPDSADVLQVRWKLVQALLELGELDAARRHVESLRSLKARPVGRLSLNERTILESLEHIEGVLARVPLSIEPRLDTPRRRKRRRAQG